MLQAFKAIPVKHQQRSAEWYKARLGNVTASEVEKCFSFYARLNKAHITEADFLYANHPELAPPEVQEYLKEKYPVWYCVYAGVDIKENDARATYRKIKVAERITGQPADEPFVSNAMKWGMITEDDARRRYIAQSNCIVDEAVYMMHPDLMCGASPDGIVTDTTTGEIGNLEIKALESRNHLYKVIMLDEMPDDYWFQVQMQMWITGNAWCDFVAYDPRVKNGLRLFVKRIERDDIFLEYVLEPGIRKFLDECDRDQRKFYAIMHDRLKKAKEGQEVV